MKATLEVPDDLMRRAEAEAIRQGISVDEFVRQSLARSLPTVPRITGRRASFPIFGSKAPGALVLTETTLRNDEAQDDLQRSGLLG